jgi:primosomal protein N' (replication factor Y) (superfamily II helicase)
MFAEVVFPLPFRNSFTYKIPHNLSSLAQERVRVVAPFGKRILTGFIISLSRTSDKEKDLKEIIDVLDDKPVFSKSYLSFFKWLSDYYLCSPGEAIKLAVPYGFEIESKKRIITDPAFCNNLLTQETGKESARKKVLEVLAARKQITFPQLQKFSGQRNIYSVIRKLSEEGAVTVIDELKDGNVKVKKQSYARINASTGEIYDAIPVIEEKAPVQVKILLELMSHKKDGIPVSKLLKKTGASPSSLASLQRKNLVELFSKEVERKFHEQYSETDTEFILTEAQKRVIDEVAGFVRKKEFKPFLLHGVTGSGKTQVYVELTREALLQNKSVILLVPEISLTPQITSRFINAFGDKVAVLHSKMSKGERFDSWRKIREKGTRIVIGPRSALFAPVNSPGLIIIDEEHDQSYKQGDTIPRYHARDAAIMLGSFVQCPVLLGSATPSVETMFNAENAKYILLKLPERIDNAKLPEITLVNILKAQKQKGMENVFSKVLLEKIGQSINKKEGVILLQNRRGFSTQVFCNDCGEVEKCDNCSVPMVFHINRNTLDCHYCGFMKKAPAACNYCGSLSLKFFGTGTERVEDEIGHYFPSAKIKRIDSDSISRKNSLSKILNEFGRGEIDILIGTQMVSKGLDFPRVTLVGVIAAETSLWLPDFRADERTFQLLTQVAGRAGRSSLKGEVIIQTRNEKNFALQKVIQNDYSGFYLHEIGLRQAMFYPPFTRLCLIEFKDSEEENVKGAAEDFSRFLYAYREKLKISPPAPAIIARIKGQFRYQIIVRSIRESDPGGALLRKAIQESMIEFNKISRYREIRYIIDIDPQSIM